jgi:hypothetical protein
MKTIATLDPETARLLVEHLAAQGIACECVAGTDENGLDTTELQVADDCYDPACDAVEQWDQKLREEYESQSARRCPACGSRRVEIVRDIDYEKTLTKIPAIYHCQDCAHVFAPRQ